MNETKELVKNPLVSVTMPVYNHEKYIRYALDSVLMQKVNFEYEIVIGEDCSTDKSREIILEYVEKYPDKILLLARDTNWGTKENVFDMRKKCRGKYIAMLEGDDYWIDEYKLQKQVDFLEANPEYSAVSCLHKIVDQDNVFMPDVTEAQLGCVVTGRLTKELFEEGYYPGQFGTLLHKNFINEKAHLYEKLFDCHKYIGDVTAWVVLLSIGDIYVMDEYLSAYRFVMEKDGTNWSSVNAEKNRCYEKHIYKLNLERASKKYIDYDIDFFQHRFELLIMSIKIMLKSPKWKNISVFLKILVTEPRKLRMFKNMFLRIFAKDTFKKEQKR